MHNRIFLPVIIYAEVDYIHTSGGCVAWTSQITAIWCKLITLIGQRLTPLNFKKTGYFPKSIKGDNSIAGYNSMSMFIDWYYHIRVLLKADHL